MSEVQDAAIQKMRRLKVGALFMEMGTGKTKVALDLMHDRRKRVDVFLWICPCALKGEIERERVKWHPDLSIMVVGCESIGASERIYMETLSAVEGKKAFVVVDESLKIKNIGAKRTRRILAIGALATYKLVLNGTPISNNVMDIWSQMEFLDRRILDMGYRAFMWTYAETKDLKDSHGKFLCKRVVGQRNEAHLMSRIEPYVFDSKLFLEVQRDYERVTYSVGKSEYLKVKNELFDQYSELEQEFSFFAVIARLQRWYCQQNRNAVKATMDSIREKEPDAQIIVFVKYVDGIPIDQPHIHGGVSKDVQNEIIRRFTAGEIRTLYITYGVGAYGLNLQTAHHIIFAEHTWDYAQRVQAEARIYRMGQNETCHYYDIVCDVPLERRIIGALDNKESFSNSLKKAIQSAKDAKKAIKTFL